MRKEIEKMIDLNTLPALISFSLKILTPKEQEKSSRKERVGVNTKELF